MIPLARGREGGFTLVELLVVLVALPLLVGALATMMISLMRNTVAQDPAGTAVRLADSHDAQLTSVYFTRDVADARYITTSVSPLCGPSGAGNDQILGLEWTAGGNTISVSYFVQQSPLQLVRYYCSSSSSPSGFPMTLTSTSLISDNILNTASAVGAGTCPASGFGSGATNCAVNGSSAYIAVTVNCFTSSPPAVNAPCPALLGSTPTAANPGLAANGSNASNTGIGTVRIQVRESYSSYQYSLTGTPRSSNRALIYQNAGTYPPFVSNGPVSSGNCMISTDGGMAVNSVVDGSISNQPGGNITASGGIFTTDTNFSGATSGSKGMISPSPIYSAQQGSPYDGQTDPPPALTSGQYHVITETATNWDPSTDSTIETDGVLNTSAEPIIFRVQNGMKVSKSFSAPQGTLFYVSGGNVDLGGNGTIYLNSVTPNFESPTQPLPEIVLWISRSDVSPSNPPTLTLGGNGNTTSINGAIYAPTAAVTINGGGGNGGISVSNLDVGTITSCNGGGSTPDNVSVGYTFSATSLVPSASSIAAGTAIRVTATVDGSGSATGAAPTGSVTFYECGPAAGAGCGQTAGWTATAGSPPGGNQVGTAAVALSPAASTPTSTAQSTSFAPTVPGTYCFSATYSGDSTYPSSSDTSSDGCFTVSAVAPPSPIILAPTSGTCYNGTGSCSVAWPDQISGSALPGTNSLAGEQVAMGQKQGSTYQYWDGTGFNSTSPVWWPATDTSALNDWATWSYNFPSDNFPGSLNQYAVSAESTDSAGLTSSAATTTFSAK